jgi:5-oxoprolinase (ATP-hydrolysing)
MYHIRNNAESSVRNLLRDVAKKLGTTVLSAVDYLDDGSPVCPLLKRMTADVVTHRRKFQICLRVEINEDDGSAVFDFEGTGCEVRGNLNSPISVVHSAVIYCVRAMLDLDIPLNAGCLVPLDSKSFDSTS